MKKAIVIINPKAGKARSKTIFYDVADMLCKNNYNVRCVITQHAGHATEIAKKIKPGKYDLIVVSGGDGTLKEVTSGLVAQDVKTPVCYIPSGSTNDFAMSAGIPLDPKKAIKAIEKGKDCFVDIGLFGENYFNYVASFGAFTAVSYKTPQISKNMFGHFAYFMESMKDLGSLVPHHVKIETEHGVYEGDYFFGAIGNSTSIGGLIKIKEEFVSMSDGQFEVLLIKAPKNPIDFTNIVQGITFSDFSNRVFEFFKASELKITTKEKLDWTLDGEYQEGAEEINVKIIKDAFVLSKKVKK